MQTDFTSQLLIRHLYHETTEIERQLLEEEFAKDHELNKQFLQLKEVLQELSQLKGEAPSRHSVRVILDYAHSQMETV